MRDECERRLESWEVCARARGVSSGISGCLGRDPSLAQPPNYTNWRCLSSGGRCGQQSFNDYGLGCGAYCGARASESWKFLKWRPRLICALIFSPISNHFPPLWESKSRRLVSPLWWRAVQKFGCWSRTTERESHGHIVAALWSINPVSPPLSRPYTISEAIVVQETELLSESRWQLLTGQYWFIIYVPMSMKFSPIHSVGSIAGVVKSGRKEFGLFYQSNEDSFIFSDCFWIKTCYINCGPNII